MLTATDLLDLAEQVARLSVSRHDPERFFVDRSEIAHRLRMAARSRVPLPALGRWLNDPRNRARSVVLREGSHGGR
jgi:hypothetical protein